MKNENDQHPRSAPVLLLVNGPAPKWPRRGPIFNSIASPGPLLSLVCAESRITCSSHLHLLPLLPGAPPCCGVWWWLARACCCVGRVWQRAQPFAILAQSPYRLSPRGSFKALLPGSQSPRQPEERPLSSLNLRNSVTRLSCFPSLEIHILQSYPPPYSRMYR